MLLTQQLKHLREQNGYSQTDLAHELGISRQSVSKWERGENFPDINNLLRLSELYNVSLDELVRGSQFLRRPFVVGRKVHWRRLIVDFVLWTVTCLLLTGFGYQPWWLFGGIFLCGIILVIPVDFDDYWIVEKTQIRFVQYDRRSLHKFLQVLGLAHKTISKIPYTMIDNSELLYNKRQRMPFDWYPDNFGLRLYLKDQRQIYLPLKQNFTQYLPQFILSLKKKGIVTGDAQQLQTAIMNKENLYTYMEKRLSDGDAK